MNNISKVVLMGAAVLALTAGPSLATEVALWGSTTCQKRFLEPGAAALENATGVKIRVFGVGTGKGMAALLEGKTEVAITSNDLEGTIRSAQKVRKEEGKAAAPIPENLQFHEITLDVIVPIVHESNPLDRLTWEQLADLNSGKVTNWNQLGGPNLPVQVVTSHTGSSTRAVFQDMVMKKAPYAETAIKVKSTRLEINEVSKNKGGIGAVSEGFFKLNPGNAKTVATQVISRPLALVTIGAPSPSVQKIIDFFRSPEGRQYILE